MVKNICIYAEQKEMQLRKVTQELLGAGRRLADQAGCELSAVLLGKGIENLIESIKCYGVDKIFVANDPLLENYTTDIYTTVLANAVKQHQLAALFMGNTSIGKDLAPRVAERLNTGLITDSTMIVMKGDQFIFTRPVFAGKAFARMECLAGEPVMATVRPNVLGVSDPVGSRSPQVIKLDVRCEPDSMRTIVRELLKKTTGRVELTEADIIVSGGRGMKCPENFRIIEALADVLGAAVGVSHAVVDAGWLDHQYQVGQTGKTVSPNLYVACGISGAIQHLAGMSSSKCIVAINNDPEANIFKVADYGIVDDLFKVVPVLTEEFSKIMG